VDAAGSWGEPAAGSGAEKPNGQEDWQATTGKEVANFRVLKSLGIVPYSKTQVMRLVKAGKFPEPFKVGDFKGSPLVWWVGEVVEWLEAKAKAGSGWCGVRGSSEVTLP